jgi:hypothetical protein
LDEWGRRQHGLVTARQLGLSRDAVRHAVRSGRLERLRPGVFRVIGSPATREQAWLAAVLALPGAVLSHASAWALWVFSHPPDDDRIDLLRPGDTAPRGAGIRGHRTEALPSSHFAVHRMIPVTSPERTFLDASGLLTERALELALDDALRARLLSLPLLIRALESVPVSGRRPSAAVRRLLEDRVPGYNPGGSDAELDVVRLCRRAGVPLPRQQHRVTTAGRTYFLDFAWPERRHAIEWDGYAFHSSVSSFHRDRTRLRELQRLGWTVWQVTSRTSQSELLAILDVASGRRAAS